MRPSDRTWIAVTLAGGFGALTLLPLTTDSGYLYPAWLMIGLLGVVAVVGDRLRLSKPVVNAIQLLLATAMAISLAIGPGPSDVAWFGRLVPLLRSGYDHIRTQSAPMQPDPGARIILVLVVVLLFFVAGVIADTLERPGWSLAPLLTLYLIPAIALRSDVNVVSFLVVVVGYLAILFADGLNSDRSWTRNISKDSASQVRGSRGIWRLAGVVAMPALVGSVILGLLLPTMSPTFLSSLRPNGSGPIEMVDPQLDLRKNLEQGTNRQVLSYTTNKATGVYLRLATLPALSTDGWGQAQVTLKQGAIGVVPGLTAMPAGGARVTKVKIDDLRSMYLPSPYAPRAENAAGEWSYDPASLMIIATGNNRARATEGLTYTVESWDIEPDGTALSEARVGNPDGQTMTRDMPGVVPASIVQLTEQLTDGIDQPALKAAAIQAYLRSSQFTYSVQGANGQTSYAAMESFLLKSKTGYCVQFASSMALMARIAGVPSRVAIGFLPGTKSSDTWLVTSHDMHAWPELYFEGQGWVRFEPTPSVATAPTWTVLAPNQPSASTSTVVDPSVSASAGPTSDQTDIDKAPVDENQGQVQAASQWRTWLLVAGIVLIVLLLLAAPMVIRRLVRRRRLGLDGDPHEAVAKAWLEVRDTWLDLGQRWPRGTPRQIAGVVAARLPDDASETALSRVVDAVERSRYAPSYEDVADLRTQVDAVLVGLHSSRPWYRRLEQVMFPPSLTYRLRQWWRRVSTPKAPPALEETVEREASPDDEAYQRPVGAGQR